MATPSTPVICKDIEGESYSVAANQLTFRPAVYAVIIQDGKILLSKQWDGYDFPGGGIKLGESNMATLAREVFEETGLLVEVQKILFANNSFFKMPQMKKYVHSIHLYYQCSVTGGELTTANFEEDEKQYASMAQWVPLETFKNLKFYTSANAQEILDAYKINESRN